MMQPGPSGGYDDADCERWVPESGRAGRTDFQRDRARVMHSAALRRLAGKTQVLVPGESDFPRTRLTHSLECGQVGREIGHALGCDADLVEVACLAHDLGHPPFGHNGEEALDEIAADCGGFEGNAQSLRVLTRLEAKRFAADGRSVGLNLTRAALDAATKYPWARSRQRRKFGVYDDDVDVFAWLRAGAPEGRTCLEAQIMDWSDDVAYSVHDVEDAVHGGSLDPASLADPGERREVLELAVARYSGAYAGADELGEALDRLLALPQWPGGYDGSLRSLAGLKDLTSSLIGRFAVAAEKATREQYGGAPLRRYAANLVVPRGVRLECDVLKAMAARCMMVGRVPEQRYERQRRLVHQLVERLAATAPASLDAALLPGWEAAASETERLRVIIDAVALLTDGSAVTLHDRIGA